ncbi:micronuclear linker histone polyprotein [Drosophila bipectinata]|uniref:micronuclear linker histone polyprotein n=1 Tax=Drosophila bipectinata TaxID=42026 RepID=UPI001C8AE816|nr:M-phase phosphoprotein 8 isoform X1 [Drosophila bipectinata]
MVKVGKKKVVEELSRKKIKNGADTDEDGKKQTVEPVERATRRSSNADTGSSGSISTASSAARKKNAQKRKAKSTDRSGSEDSDDLPLNGRASASANAKDDDSRAATPAKKRKQTKQAAATKAPEKAPEKASSSKNGKKSAKPAGDKEVAANDSKPDGGEDEFEVEAIVGHKTVRGVSYFQVRWKGYDKSEDTWEPEADLNCKDLIAKFKAKETKQENTKVKAGKGPKPAAKKAGTGTKGRASSANTAAAAGGKKSSATSDDPEKEWVVERIIDYVDDEKDGGLYRIRWKGFGRKDDTWEPESNLSCEDLIEKFKRKMESQANVDAKFLRESPKKTKRLVNECYPRTNFHNRIERTSKRAAAKNRIFYGED